jgi:uncharacterized integral membrane protein (TIGR00698 family)
MSPVPDGETIRTMQAADLYQDLAVELDRRPGARDYGPGLAVAAAATLAAGYLADHYRAPLTLMALLTGLALNFLGTDKRLSAGLAVASHTLLRVGIVLVGARVTVGQIIGLGPAVLIAILAIVAATIGTGVIAARKLGLGGPFGVVAGGAVAICGASAAMAFASLLGERRLGQAQLALTLVGISAASALAMFLYPIVAHHLGLSDRQAGFMLGASIHDVAQALGAGYSFSPTAGQIAAIVKLTRVALLAPAMAIIAIFYPASADDPQKRPAILPWFVVGFFVCAAINSTGAIPAVASEGAQRLATACLACAVAATGIRSPMTALLDSGARPVATIAVTTVVTLLLALAAGLALVHA